MRTFTVHANASLPKEQERVRFVKEGIAWGALLAPLIWFLYHRMWWEAAFAFALSILLTVGGDVAGLNENLILIAGILFQVLIAVEANDLRRLSLARKAYRSVAVVHAEDEGEAELRFFTDWKGPLPTADIGATTSSVFDRRGEAENLITALMGQRKPIWPNVTSSNAGQMPSSGTSDARSDEDVLGVFPKPQS
jgi:uncharacterized protein DUF2628